MVSKASLEREFESFASNISKLEGIGRELEKLDTRGFDAEARGIKSKLKNVNAVSEVQRRFSILKKNVEAKKKKTASKRTNKRIVKHVAKKTGHLKRKISNLEKELDKKKKISSRKLPGKYIRHVKAIPKLESQVRGLRDQLAKHVSSGKIKVDSGVGVLVNSKFDDFVGEIKSELTRRVKSKEILLDDKFKEDLHKRTQIFSKKYRQLSEELHGKYKKQVEKGLQKEIKQRFKEELERRLAGERDLVISSLIKEDIRRLSLEKGKLFSQLRNSYSRKENLLKRRVSEEEAELRERLSRVEDKHKGIVVRERVLDALRNKLRRDLETLKIQLKKDFENLRRKELAKSRKNQEEIREKLREVEDRERRDKEEIERVRGNRGKLVARLKILRNSNDVNKVKLASIRKEEAVLYSRLVKLMRTEKLRAAALSRESKKKLAIAKQKALAETEKVRERLNAKLRDAEIREGQAGKEISIARKKALAETEKVRERLNAKLRDAEVREGKARKKALAKTEIARKKALAETEKVRERLNAKLRDAEIREGKARKILDDHNAEQERTRKRFDSLRASRLREHKVLEISRKREKDLALETFRVQREEQRRVFDWEKRKKAYHAEQKALMSKKLRSLGESSKRALEQIRKEEGEKCKKKDREIAERQRAFDDKDKKTRAKIVRERLVINQAMKLMKQAHESRISGLKREMESKHAKEMVDEHKASKAEFSKKVSEIRKRYDENLKKTLERKEGDFRRRIEVEYKQKVNEEIAKKKAHIQRELVVQAKRLLEA